ncbi:Cell division control protein 1 [Exophiala dermatitidis]
MKTKHVSAGSHAFARIKRRLWSLPSALVLLWIFVLFWGERRVFQRSAAQCLWHQWESWPPHAHPHHVLLIADPQLVDPHTYPGRPWPLSSLTVLYTDLYLQRAYRYLQEYLRPDATLFLGDLFDGGREWGTLESTSPEERYQKYGTDFWLKEYMRFSNIFIRPWLKYPSATAAEPTGRRILASLPGNHDLGFAAGIQAPVKERFDAYFGPLNRIDIIGNHSFVHLDTVSLSAMDQVDSETGSSGAGDGSAAATASSKIWKPVEEFLAEAKTTRAKAIQHTCETRFNWTHPVPHLFSPEVREAADGQESEEEIPKANAHLQVTSSQFPTIVLSHVPLYRSGSTSCGPMRERGTAIPLQAGYQYQNVLTPLVSQDIVKHLTAEEITMIYSGDDHDYCETEHNEFTGRIREITVKSMSWAMGIRLPGVQLVSLWNPVDVDNVMGAAATTTTPRDTVQNHLCLLPDQLGIFIRYGQVLALTLLVLLVQTARYNPEKAAADGSSSQRDKAEPLLPVFRERECEREHRTSETSQTSSVRNHGQNLSTRKIGSYGHVASSSSSRSRTPSPSSKQPSFANTSSYRDYHRSSEDDDVDGDDWGMPRGAAASVAFRVHKPTSRLEYLGRSMWQVAWPVLVFYLWLIWNG